MIIILLKLLSTLTLPILACIIWQRRTSAAWSVAGFALLEVAVNTAISQAIRPLIINSPFFFSSDMLLGKRFVAGVLTLLLVYGVIRFGIPLLVFRFVAKNVHTWKDGVLYGLTRAVFAGLVSHGLIIRRELWLLTFAPNGPLPDDASVLNTIKDLSIDDAIEILQSLYRWRTILIRVIDMGSTPIVFGVAASVAILYSIRQKKVWPLAAAFACYYVVAEAPFKLQEIMFITDNIGKLQLPFIRYDHLLFSIRYIPVFLALIPSIFLIVHVRKRMESTQAPPP